MGKKRLKIRVIIADDHSLFAAAVQAILGADERFEVVGLACDGCDAVAQATRKTPDVVLMDIAMPVLDGFAATKEIRRRLPGLPVVMLTGSNARLDIDRARKAGAAGYLTKDRIAGELIDAIVDVTGS
jgi:two-component system, NarL family, response regulator LiaR